MKTSPIIDKASYQRGYAAALKRRGIREIPAPTLPARSEVRFDMPSGRRIVLSFPADMSLDDVEYFSQVSGPYLAAHLALSAGVATPEAGAS